MESLCSEDSWFEKESAVFFKVTRLPLLLVLLWLGSSFCPLGQVGLLLLFTIPYFLIFVCVILTLWGAALVCLGLSRKESVFALIAATLACSLPPLIVLIALACKCQ
jgi:hypothetical protein